MHRFSLHVQQTSSSRLDGMTNGYYRRFDEEAINNMGLFSQDNEPTNDRTTTKEKEYLTQIKDFVETTVIIKKESAGLGIQIVGGTDTYLRGILIKFIEQNGAADKDGRLRVGDQILEVNGVSMEEMSHDKAVSTIRVASSPVRLLVFREDPEAIFTSKQNPKSLIKVRIYKSISECLGLSILSRRDGNGVFVTYVTEGSVVDLEGTIQQGDRIMEVNNQNLRNATQEYAAQILKRCFGNIKLIIGRIPSLSSSIQASANKRRPCGHVNYGLESDKDSSPRRFRSGSHGSYEPTNKRITSTPNDHTLGMPKQRRRSITMLETSLQGSIRPKDFRLSDDVIKHTVVEPETLQVTIDEHSLHTGLYESHGREDYV